MRGENGADAGCQSNGHLRLKSVYLRKKFPLTDETLRLTYVAVLALTRSHDVKYRLSFPNNADKTRLTRLLSVMLTLIKRLYTLILRRVSTLCAVLNKAAGFALARRSVRFAHYTPPLHYSAIIY